MKPIELLETHCEFNNKHDVYVLLAVSRKKDTPEITNSQEIVFRKVIASKDDIKDSYNKIIRQINNYKDINGKSFPFYLYVSLNSRDTLKATFLLQSKINFWMQKALNGEKDTEKFFKKIDKHFISCLAKKESRGNTKYFMIDYDQKDDLGSFLNLLNDYEIQYSFYQKTKNGYHIKINAQDVRSLYSFNDNYDFELKRDAQLFVEYITNK